MSSGQFEYRVDTMSFSSLEEDEKVREMIENFLINQTETENFQWSLSSTFSYTMGDTVKLLCIFEMTRNERS